MQARQNRLELPRLSRHGIRPCYLESRAEQKTESEIATARSKYRETLHKMGNDFFGKPKILNDFSREEIQKEREIHRKRKIQIEEKE